MRTWRQNRRDHRETGPEPDDFDLLWNSPKLRVTRLETGQNRELRVSDGADLAQRAGQFRAAYVIHNDGGDDDIGQCANREFKRLPGDFGKIDAIPAFGKLRLDHPSDHPRRNHQQDFDLAGLKFFNIELRTGR